MNETQFFNINPVLFLILKSCCSPDQTQLHTVIYPQGSQKLFFLYILQQSKFPKCNNCLPFLWNLLISCGILKRFYYSFSIHSVYLLAPFLLKLVLGHATVLRVFQFLQHFLCIQGLCLLNRSFSLPVAIMELPYLMQFQRKHVRSIFGTYHFFFLAFMETSEVYIISQLLQIISNCRFCRVQNIITEPSLDELALQNLHRFSFHSYSSALLTSFYGTIFMRLCSCTFHLNDVIRFSIINELSTIQFLCRKI